MLYTSPRPLHQVPSHHADMLNNKGTTSSAYGLYPQLSNQHPLTCVAKSSSEVRESAKFRLLITGTTQCVYGGKQIADKRASRCLLLEAGMSTCWIV